MTRDSGTTAGATTGRATPATPPAGPTASTAPAAVPAAASAAPPTATGRTFWLEHAWLGDRVEPGVTVAVGVRGDGGGDGRITAVTTDVPAPPPGAEILRGLTLPGLANAHSHAFHRALRGTVQVGAGTFWTWREVMYSVADRLTPETYHRLARAVYAEMALAGITAVGEFHYLHHAPDGTPYADPNAMGEALIAAAAEAGVRITLLDTAYLSAGFGEPPTAHQRRFSDGTAEAWAERCSVLKERDHARIGAAIHSVRAVPAREPGDRGTLGGGATGPAARAPVGADRRERGVPGGARPHPDPPSRRPRRARTAHHRHPQHTPHRPGHRAHRRQRHRHLHVPHHGTRPGRRQSAPRPPSSARAPRCPSARTATPSSTCWRRRAPWS
ncbi:hypothetical protein SHIRM173S_03591 [Streptomyces hirsutus]